MLIYAKQTGETFLYSENINQGSVNANGIDLLAPFPKTAVVTAAFELPNGQVTTPKVLSLVSADTEIEGMHLWRYIFEAPITQYAGTLKISLFVTARGATIALDRVSVTLGASVPYEITSTSVSWDSILQIYESMRAIRANILHDAELTGNTTAQNLTVTESLKVPTPTEDDEAAPKGYVDELDKSSLKQVSSMPSNPSVGDIVQWVGGSAYKKGYFYKYNGSVWEEAKVQDTEATARWGNIGGTLTDQTDLATALGTKQEKYSLSLQTEDKYIVDAINEVNNIAKGANIAVAIEDYYYLVEDLNRALRLYKTGQSIYIVKMNVPDVWVEDSGDDEPTEYTYTSDEDFISSLMAGTLYIGYYHIHPLETQKVDLTNYRTKAEQDVIDNGKASIQYVDNAVNGKASIQYVDNAVNGIKGIIVEASTNKTVNGLQVPSLTDEQLLAIYNAIVAGKAVTITDATGKMHFTGVTADMISDEVFVSFVYFDKMVLEYGEGGETTFKEIGAGGGVSTMLSIDSTDYAPTVTDDGEYQNIESSADIKYSDGGVERSTQVDFNIKVPTHETFAGDGLTKNGRTLSVDRNMTPVYDDFGHYAGLVPMTTGDRVWGQAFMSSDPVPYAIAQRNSSGGLTGIQDQLYIHEGKMHLGTTTYLYKFAVRGKPTSFEEVTDVFPTEPEVCHYIWTVPVGTSNGTCILKGYTLVDEDEIRYYVLSSPGSRKTGSISDDNTYIVYDSVYAV